MSFYFHSFIYAPLCSKTYSSLTAFQHLFLIRLQPSTAQNKGWGGKMVFFGWVFWETYSSEGNYLSNSRPVVDFTHFCLTHTGVSLQQCALTFRGLCYMTPFLTLLRTRGFRTVKKGPIRQFRPRGLCLELAFKELWSLSALTYRAFRQAEMISCPVIRGGRGYKATPHLPWQALKATTLFIFLLPSISHYTYKPQLYLYPGFFGLFF